jgi:quinohemoprotein ethanol dehydrogenase
MRKGFSVVVATGMLAATLVGLASAGKAVSNRAAAPRVSPEAANAYLPLGVTPAGTDWTSPGGEITSTAYSTLSQINTGNVANLKMTWQDTFTGYNQNPETFESQPIVVSGKGKNLPLETGTMFFTLMTGVVALDPLTGTTLWQYQGPVGDTTQTGAPPQLHAARDESYGRGLVFAGQQDGSIVALNAKTGAAIWTAQLTAAGNYGASTHHQSCPYTQFYDDGKDGLVIAGVNGGESPLRGHLDAFNAKTGELVWRTWTTPDPTQLPYILTWANPAEAATAGASVWSIASVDPELQTVYFGTGNAYPETGRQPGKNLWTDSIMAVSLKNGALKWYFQQVHHDEWDYDVPNPPNRFNAMIDGKRYPVVATGGKNGYMYVLDARNGRLVPHFPIPEVPVPNLNGGKGALLNKTWPTQPEPQGGAGQIVPTCYDDALMKEKFPTTYPTAPNGTPMIPTCPYAPPYNDAYLTWGAIGSGGAMGWPRTSYSPQTNDLYICAQVQAGGHENVSPNNPSQLGISVGTDTTGQGTPGWAGSVAALNMGTNKIDWLVKYYQYPDGDCYSGTLATAGGLVFVASRADERISDPLLNLPIGTKFGGFIYAYDAKTGKQLWSWQADDLIQAPPVTYSVKGKQYVAELVQGHQGRVRDARLTVFSL